MNKTMTRRQADKQYYLVEHYFREKDETLRFYQKFKRKRVGNEINIYTSDFLGSKHITHSPPGHEVIECNCGKTIVKTVQSATDMFGRKLKVLLLQAKGKTDPLDWQFGGKCPQCEEVHYITPNILAAMMGLPMLVNVIYGDYGYSCKEWILKILQSIEGQLLTNDSTIR